VRGLLTAPEVAFDLERRYALHPQVALRSEPFGALAYHYGNRRLIFIRSASLVELVRGLDRHPSAAAALDALGIPDQDRTRLRRALEQLEHAQVIHPLTGGDRCAPTS
jgi:putative mycofactocin binding protein MftB